MSYVQTGAIRNRVNPLSISTVEQPAAAPYVTYDEVALCADPNCPVCRAQRRDKHQKRHRHNHHHHRRHRKRRTNFWGDIFPRVESAGSTVSVHSIELGDRRTYHNSNVVQRDVVPVNQTERQVVTTTTNRPNRYADEEIAREAWVRHSHRESPWIVCRHF